MSDLVGRLRIKAGMIEMGELIAWGSDSALMREAADALEENAKFRAELGQWAVDGWKLVPVEPTPEMVSAAEEAHMPFGDMDIALRMAILSAPSATATVPSVNQQLLEAVTAAFEFVNKSGEHDSVCDVFDLDDDDRHKDCNCGLDAIIRALYAAIAAARKGEGE